MRRETREAAKSLLALGVLALVVVAVHWPAERADFSFDDRSYVAMNPSLRSLGEALAAFGAPFPPHRAELGLYRPLTNLSYALDFALSGEDSRAYHVTNVLLYVASVWLIFALGREYGAGSGFALAFALLFAVLPVHCEVVDSVTGRSELLALLFGVASLCFFVRSSRGPLWLSGVSALLYAASAFAKETGVMLLAVLLAHFLAFGLRAGETLGGRVRRAAVLLAPHAVVGVAYLFARFAALDGLAPTAGALAQQSLLFRLYAMGMASFQYARLLVYPRVLQVDYYWALAFFQPRETLLESALGWALLAASLLALVLLLRRITAEVSAAAIAPPSFAQLGFCGIATYLAFLFPVSHVLPVGTLMAERFLYAPSLGFCLLVAAAGRSALRSLVADPRWRTVLAAAVVALCVVAGGARSQRRALEWRDEVRFWQVAARDVPDDSRVYTNLAVACRDRGLYREAREALTRARASEPRIAEVDRTIDALDFDLRQRHGL